MKTFDDRFEAVVELRELGPEIVLAKVSSSLRLDRIDSALLSSRILLRLLPDNYVMLRCDDGSYVILDGSGDFGSVDKCCIPAASRALADFDFPCELMDFKRHDVHFSLNQVADNHRDYVFAGSRFIVLRGTISVKVDDDELSEG